MAVNERLTDEQFAEIERAVPWPNLGGSLDDPEISAWARRWIGPDGGTLSLLNELKAERARVDAVLGSHYPAKVHKACQEGACPCDGRQCVPYCLPCDVPWPCDTYKALTGEESA